MTIRLRGSYWLPFLSQVGQMPAMPIYFTLLSSSILSAMDASLS